MNKIFVCTFNKKIFEINGQKLLNSYINTNQKLPLYCYVEDDISYYPKYPNVIFINLYDAQPESKKFVERNLKKYEKLSKISYLLDAVRFSFKVFAQNDARKYGDHIFYIDSDIEFLQFIPDTWFNECLPDKIFTAFYDRLGFYSETGFIGFNNLIKNKNNERISDIFFQQYTNYYIYDLIYSLPAFTDCHAFDATRWRFLFLERKTNEHGNYNEKKLGNWSIKRNMDVMKHDPFINKYLIHKKGEQ